MKRLLQIGCALVLVALLWIHFDRSRDRLAASRTLLLAEQLGIELARSGSASESRAGQAMIQRLRQVQELDPSDARIPLAIGSLHLIQGHAQASIRWYEEALQIEARPEIYLNLGRAHASLGQEAEATEAFVKAVRLDRLRRREVPSEYRSRLLQ